jgi:KIF-binding protein
LAFKNVPGDDVYHNRAFEPKGRQFRFLYEGGSDHEAIEDAYTLTLFYLAQAYTKMELREQAAENCGRTLQRQHTSGKYELREFVTNLIGLAEYYQGSKYYAQAQYILMLALKVIPEGKKHKLRATVQIAIGNLIADLLEFGCERINHKDVKEGDSIIVGKQIMLFPEFDQAFPKVVLPEDIEACKSLFRQANTQFKKALEVFVLDGYVTEHIEVLFSQSRLYRSLALLETKAERKASMLDKRREMLEPLLKELNPKAYPGTWQKILVETSEIVNDLFSLRVALLSVKGFPSEEKLGQTYELGRKSIGYFKEIIQTLIDDKDTPRNEQYFRSIINSKINIAKAASKLMSSDRKKRVEYLKESFELYKAVLDYIKKDIPAEFRDSFNQELALTNDMVAMMPAKIDRVNYGPLTFID